MAMSNYNVDSSMVLPSIDGTLLLRDVLLYLVMDLSVYSIHFSQSEMDKK